MAERAVSQNLLFPSALWDHQEKMVPGRGGHRRKLRADRPLSTHTIGSRLYARCYEFFVSRTADMTGTIFVISIKSPPLIRRQAVPSRW